MVNYLALLGWHPEGEKEIFTVEELAREFTLERIQKSSGVFDEVKLRWFNHEHMKLLSAAQFVAGLRAYMNDQLPTYIDSIAQELKNRAQTYGDAAELLRNGEFSFMEGEIPTPSKELLLQGAKAEADTVKTHLRKVLELLPTEAFTPESVKEALFPYATEVGRASVLWPLRVALSGKEKSPDPFTLAGLLGKETTISRNEKALAIL